MVAEVRFFFLGMMPGIRSSDSPHCCETNACDCGGSCGGCGKQRKKPDGVSYVYYWKKDPNWQSVTDLYRHDKESPVRIPERMGHLHNMGGGMWSFTFERDNAGIPKGRHAAFDADGCDAAKRYVETNVLHGITVAPDNAEPAAAEVALDAQKHRGFWWSTEGADHGGFLFFTNGKTDNGLLHHDFVCHLLRGDSENIYTPKWIGVFEGDTGYPFYAPSLDAARRAIEEKAREKIEANYSKWVRLKEAWKPLED